MTAEESRLVDIFMKTQAEPTGEMFSENVLRGLKAVLEDQRLYVTREQVRPQVGVPYCSHYRPGINSDSCEACGGTRAAHSASPYGDSER